MLMLVTYIFMRKIAANYILLPGYPLVKNGYVMVEGRRIEDVVDTGGIIKEIQGLEFYGGMIVAGEIFKSPDIICPGGKILPLIEHYYAGTEETGEGLAIIKGADLVHLEFLGNTVIELLV